MESKISGTDGAIPKPRTAAQIAASRANIQKSSGKPRLAIDPKRVRQMLADGRTRKQVAALLGVSRWTLHRRIVEWRELEHPF